MPTPVLSRTHRSQDAGICGAFTCIDDWVLTNRVLGVIVQKITRTVSVSIKSGGLDLPLSIAQMISAFDPSNTALFLNTLVYWELFVVGTGPIAGDQFQSNWFAKSNNGQPVATTNGVYTITGQARFYATTASRTALGFPQSGVPMAAGLPSTTVDPSANLVGLPSSALVTRTVTSQWDSGVVSPPHNARGQTILTIG